MTGASSGIGKAITTKLANQGINVVMVALDDDFMKKSLAELRSTFDKVQFLPVSCGAFGAR